MVGDPHGERAIIFQKLRGNEEITGFGTLDTSREDAGAGGFSSRV